jgi:hypothetical protein
MEELFEEYRAAFLSNAGYRFRSRKQFFSETGDPLNLL